MFFLSEIPGRYAVGATTFLTRVPSPHPVGSVELRNHQPALYLDEVAFTAYYPADISNSNIQSKGLPWVIRPVTESLKGFAKFSSLPRWVLWPVVYFLGSLIKIPVHPNAPLANPGKARVPEKTEDLPKQWPLVIFSHGLGGSRTAYSQLCSRLAASGKVVLALEHRDGTGCACFTRLRQDDGGYQTKSILYYKDDDIILNNTDTIKAVPLPLRTDQLEFRREEIYTTYQNFCRFVRNDRPSDIETIDKSEIDEQSWSNIDSVSGKRPVCVDENITLAGHSFGGCTVLSVLSTNPPPEYTRIPISHALVLDPWLEPLPQPGPVPISQASPLSVSDPSHSAVTFTTSFDKSSMHSDVHEPQDFVIRPQMLVINSEVFTLWKDHFTRLQDVIKAWEPQGRRILSLVGSKHESFSDFPSLPIVRNGVAKTLIDIVSKLSIAFLDGNLEHILESTSSVKMEVEVVGKRKDGRPKRKLVGNVGDVVVS